MKNIAILLSLAASLVFFAGCACKSSCPSNDCMKDAPAHHDYKGEGK